MLYYFFVILIGIFTQELLTINKKMDSIQREILSLMMEQYTFKLNLAGLFKDSQFI